MIVLLLLAPRAVAGQGIGPEFQVNTYTYGSQDWPAVAPIDGGFVVVWQSGLQDGWDSGVFGQRFDRAGRPVGSEFRINTYTPHYQGHPAVASGAGGGFVVVWTSGLQDGSESGIFGQRFDAAGGPLGGEFQVNTETFSYQATADVAADDAGDFVVVWSSWYQDGSQAGVFGQRYDAAGLPQGAEFQVNTATLYSQYRPDVARAPGGDFIVVWSGFDGYGSGIFGQRYDADGAPAGGEFLVDSDTGGYYQTAPAVAVDAMGSFVVSWQSDEYSGYDGEVLARRFDGAGVPEGPAFLINDYTTHTQSDPSVAMRATGEFVVAWSSAAQDGSSQGVFAKSFDTRPGTSAGDYQVNTYTFDDQRNPALAAVPGAGFVAVWVSNYYQDGSQAGIYAQRLGVPAFADGFESGDTSRWSSVEP